MSIYQSDDDIAPDSEFEPGVLDHLVVGNRARQLDWRRTPMTVVAVRPDVGFVTMRLDAFEDVGAHWDLPFENVDHYQFALGSERASDHQVEEFRRAVERLDRTMEIITDPAARRRTLDRIDDERRAAARWLEDRSELVGVELPDPELRTGVPQLQAALADYMTSRGVDDMEAAFSRQFVSNPYAGEIVKGHRIVLAELGLVTYEGSVVRDPDTFAGAWTKRRRADHLIARLALVSAIFDRLGLDEVVLYRGFTPHDEPTAPRNDTFVSASFARSVATSHLHDASGRLLEQSVPVERVFMTYLETPEMNAMYQEAEATLLFDPDNDVF